MDTIDTAIERYGGEVLVTSGQCPEGREGFGLFSPLSFSAAQKLKIPAKPGALAKGEYLFICQSTAIVPGETLLRVSCRGREYEILRAEPVYLGGSLCHWECVARLKKEGQSDV